MMRKKIDRRPDPARPRFRDPQVNLYVKDSMEPYIFLQWKRA